MAVERVVLSRSSVHAGRTGNPMLDWDMKTRPVVSPSSLVKPDRAGREAGSASVGDSGVGGDK